MFAGEFGWWGLRGRFGSGVDPVCVFRCCLFVGCSVGSYLVLVLPSVVCYFSGLLASGVLFCGWWLVLVILFGVCCSIVVQWVLAVGLFASGSCSLAWYLVSVMVGLVLDVLVVLVVQFFDSVAFDCCLYAVMAACSWLVWVVVGYCCCLFWVCLVCGVSWVGGVAWDLG